MFACIVMMMYSEHFFSGLYGLKAAAEFMRHVNEDQEEEVSKSGMDPAFIRRQVLYLSCFVN